jgi:hypothetical protein
MLVSSRNRGGRGCHDSLTLTESILLLAHLTQGVTVSGMSVANSRNSEQGVTVSGMSVANSRNSEQGVTVSGMSVANSRNSEPESG